MIIGIPHETKTLEHRVVLDSAGVRLEFDASHSALIEARAGESVGLADVSIQVVSTQPKRTIEILGKEVLP